jgi:hypothetical protein
MKAIERQNRPLGAVVKIGTYSFPAVISVEASTGKVNVRVRSEVQADFDRIVKETIFSLHDDPED